LRILCEIAARIYTTVAGPRVKKIPRKITPADIRALARAIVHTPASLIDIMPTVVEIDGADEPPQE